MAGTKMLVAMSAAALVAVTFAHPVRERRGGKCDETLTGNGKNYKGCQSKTQNGLKCLSWKQQDANGKFEHPMFHTKFPELDDEADHCRNPDGKPMIWCFVDDANKKFDYCYPLGFEATSSSVAPWTTKEDYVWDQTLTDDDYYGYDDWWNKGKADDDGQFEYEMDDDKCDETISGDGHTYVGCQTKTISGKTCQRWTDSSPHEHSRMSVKFPGIDLNNHNYCRNPDGENTIWCYTMDKDVRWEFCDVIGGTSNKGEDAQEVHNIKEELQKVEEKLAVAEEEKAEVEQENEVLLEVVEEEEEIAQEHLYDYGDDAEGYEEWWKAREVDDDDKSREVENEIAAGDCEEALTANGHDYRGCQTKTVSGDTCQKWTVQTPQEHQRLLDTFKGVGLNNHNYCRNPDGEDTIWCYTTNPDVRWDYCDPMILAAGEDHHESKAEEEVEAEVAEMQLEEEIEEEQDHLAYEDDATGYEDWWVAAAGDDDGQAEKTLDADSCVETLTGNGHDYRGCAHLTVDGIECQKWSSQEPHKQDRFALKFPGVGLNDHNYCRNPDGEETIWCYTMDPNIRWDYCKPETGGLSKAAPNRNTDPGNAQSLPKTEPTSSGGASKIIVVFAIVALAGLAYSNKDALSEKLSDMAGPANTVVKSTTNPAYSKVANKE